MASLTESSSIHSIQDEEKISFVGYINSALKDDPDLQATLPLNPSDNSLFSSVGTGVLLGKLINVVAPGTVDWNKMKTRTVQKFNQIENLNTVLDAAKRIGCNIVNMSAEDIIAGKAHLVCGLVWQILKNGLEIKMSAAMHVQRSSANDYQDVVIEWLNSNLRSTGCDRVVKNFTSDLSDSVALTYLCNRIFPDAVSLDLLKTSDTTARAEALVVQLEKAGLKRFISVNSITHGISKLNFAFLAELLAYRPGEARPGRPTVLRGSRIYPSGILASTKLKDLDSKLTLSDTEALRRHTASPHETSTEKLRALEVEMSAQTKRLQESEAQAQAARDELAKLRQENEALRQRNAVLEEEARAAKAGAAAAESAKSSSAAPASDVDNKAQVAALETELQSAKATVAELEARVSERANLLSALDVLEAKFDEVSKSREKLQDRVRELEKERRSLKKGVKRDESQSDMASKPKTGFAQEALDRQLAVIAARNAELEQKLKMYQTEELLRMRTDSEYIKFPVKEFKGNCKRSAFLMKQSKNGKKWKKRFFILKDNYLFYWKSNKDSDKRAKFMRLNGTTVEADNDKKAVLSIAGHGRRLVLQAEDERSGAEWVSTLRDVLRMLPVPTEDVPPAGRRNQRYSTLQRIKQGFRGKEEKKKDDDKKTSPEKEKGALLKTESSPAVVGVVKPAAAAATAPPPAAAAPVAADSTDTSSSSS